MEQQTETRKTSAATEAKAKEYDEAKKSLPVVQKEADAGVRPFSTVEFQPIKGVNTFEAEFGVKGDDVIFHFWPWGYHDVERSNENVANARRLPIFEKGFEDKLKKVLAKTFGESRCDVSFDSDMGAWFVKARGAGLNQFNRELCIEAATNLHSEMGGEV